MSAPYTPDAQGYVQQPAFGISPAEVESLRSNSTIVLILGILGLVLIGPFGSIPAWIWGNSIVKKAEAAGLPSDVVSSARIGKILGIVGTVFAIVALVIVFLFFGAIMAAIMSGSFPTN